MRSCSTDEELKQVLMKDNILDILSFVGYRGVPTKETLSSKEAILRKINCISNYFFARKVNFNLFVSDKAELDNYNSE